MTSYSIITLEVLDEIFEKKAKTKVGSMAKVIYINCLMAKLKGVESTGNDSFEIKVSEMKSFNKNLDYFKELHLAGLVFLSNEKVFFIDLWNQNALESPEVKKKQLMSATFESIVPQDEKDYYLIAKAFFDLFIENSRKIGARWTHLEKTKYFDCISPIKMLIKTDKRNRDEMILVYNLLQKDTFWMQNIQSTKKLRDKFDLLITKAKNGNNPESKRPDNHTSKNADPNFFD